MSTRRGFIQGLLGLIAAPALVKARPPIVENELIDEAIASQIEVDLHSPYKIVYTGIPQATWRLLNCPPEDLKL